MHFNSLFRIFSTALQSTTTASTVKSGIRLTVTYFSSSWHHRNLAHPSKTKIKKFVCVTFKPALRASQIGIVPHPTQYMYYDVYICISIHLFREILHCWSDIHFISFLPETLRYLIVIASAVDHPLSWPTKQAPSSPFLYKQLKDLPPVASSDVTACFPDRSRSAITVEWVVKDCLFFRTNRRHPWTWQLAFPIDHALP